MSTRGPRHGGHEPVERFLEDARNALREVPRFGPERERELVGRILSRTTRQAVGSRRTRSFGIAAAAAVLVAGSAALFLVSRSAREPIDLVAAQPVSPVEPEVRSPVERTFDGEHNPLATAREELRATAAAAGRTQVAPDVAADAPLELRLLEARAKGLRERRWEPWLREVALPDLDTLSLALWCEVELDRYVLSGSRPPAWKQAVDILERDLARPETPREGSRLLTHALDRARGYGLADGVTVARLEPEPKLWSAEWFDDLDAAGREAGVAENGVWRAWVDWRGR